MFLLKILCSLWDFGKCLLINRSKTLCENCPNTEYFLVRILPHSDWIRRDTSYLSVFSPNAGKYGPENTPYLDTFHAVKNVKTLHFWRYSSKPTTGEYDQRDLNISNQFEIYFLGMECTIFAKTSQRKLFYR